MDTDFEKSCKRAVDRIKVPDQDIDSFLGEGKRSKSAERSKKRILTGAALVVVIIVMGAGINVFAEYILHRPFRTVGSGSSELIVDDHDPSTGENPGNSIVWDYSKPDTDYEAPKVYEKRELYGAAPGLYTFATWGEMASKVPFPAAVYRGRGSQDGWTFSYDSLGGYKETFVTGTYEEAGKSIKYIQSHFANDNWSMNLGIDHMGTVKEQKIYETKEGYSYTLSTFTGDIKHIYAALKLQYDMITIDFRGYSELEAAAFLQQLSMKTFREGSLTDEDEQAIRQLATDACEDLVNFLRLDGAKDPDYSEYVDNGRLNEYLIKRTQNFQIHFRGSPKITYKITEVSISPDHAIVKGMLTAEYWGLDGSQLSQIESQFCIEKNRGKLVITDWYIPGDGTEEAFRPGYIIEDNIGFWD